MSKLTLRCNFDGACNNHLEQPDMGVGLAIFINDIYCEELSKYIFIASNEISSSNIAEWIGCREAFKLIKELKNEISFDNYEIHSDSQLITRQYNKDYRITKDYFIKYFNESKIHAENAGLIDLKVTWVKRSYNKEADRLSKMGLHGCKNKNSGEIFEVRET